MIEVNGIYNMNCVEGMKQMVDSCVDLTITSPPYDNLRQYNGNISQWNWKKFTDVVNELYRVTKDGGVVVWVVGDATVKGSETGTSLKQALYFMDVGFNLHDTMIWRKTNPMPKFKSKRYFDAFEYMFVFSKGTPKTFCPLTQQCRYGGSTYDSTCKNKGGESGRTKKRFELNKERYRDNIWDIAVARNKTNHPAVFPEQLVVDHILSWSTENDTVLDPFLGSGTTAIAAIKNNRKFIGFEIDSDYFSVAESRIQDELL